MIISEKQLLSVQASKMISMFKLFMMMFTLSLLSCSSDDENNDISICVSFDERQCGGNDWLTEDINLTDAQAKVEALEAYLNNMSINTIEVSADPDFHEFVCEACFVCPTSTRYTIQIDTSFVSAITTLNLLNLEQVSCN